MRGMADCDRSCVRLPNSVGNCRTGRDGLVHWGRSRLGGVVAGLEGIAMNKTSEQLANLTDIVAETLPATANMFRREIVRVREMEDRLDEIVRNGREDWLARERAAGLVS